MNLLKPGANGFQREGELIGGDRGGKREVGAFAVLLAIDGEKPLRAKA